MEKKTIVTIDKISNISLKIWLRKGKLKKETKSLLIAAQNNAIRINYIKE